MMKKLCSILLVSILLLSVTACGGSDGDTNSSKGENLTTTASGSDIPEDTVVPTSGSDIDDNAHTRTVTLFVPNSEKNGLDEVTATIEPDERSLLAALLSKGDLPEKWELRSLFMSSDGKMVSDIASTSDLIDTELIGYLDLKSTFLESLEGLDKEKETLYIASLVNTFLFNYNMNGIYLTVEGQSFKTENQSYEDMLTFYEFD